MNFLAFQKAFKDREVISINDAFKVFPGFDTHRLSEWQKKGYLQKVVNRFYTWPQPSYSEGQRYFAAGRIYAPSYISLKSALQWYHFIPEGVFDTFSVTTRKTNTFDTVLGLFLYKHLKPNLYFGYQPVERQNGGFLIADPEKALLDTFYLYPYLKDAADMEGLRLNYGEIAAICSVERLKLYANLFENDRVLHLAKILIQKL